MLKREVQFNSSCSCVDVIRMAMHCTLAHLFVTSLGSNIVWHDPPIPRRNYCNIMYPPYTDMRPLSSNIALQFKVILCFKCWKCWLEQMEHVVNCMSCSCSVQPLHVTNLAVDVKNILKHSKNIL